MAKQNIKLGIQLTSSNATCCVPTRVGVGRRVKMSINVDTAATTCVEEQRIWNVTIHPSRGSGSGGSSNHGGSDSITIIISGDEIEGRQMDIKNLRPDSDRRILG